MNAKDKHRSLCVRMSVVSPLLCLKTIRCYSISMNCAPNESEPNRNVDLAALSVSVICSTVCLSKPGKFVFFFFSEDTNHLVTDSLRIIARIHHWAAGWWDAAVVNERSSGLNIIDDVPELS